jgi:hypothetical protein
MQGGTAPSDLERELKNSERDAFAGLWIRHKPDYGVTVAARDFDDVKEKARSHVEGTQWEGTVRTKAVEATLVELHAARAEAERMLDRLGTRYDSGYDSGDTRTGTARRSTSKTRNSSRASCARQV